MIVVSGCPRSGTSLTMDLLRVALGDDRILGEKFPQKDPDKMLERVKKRDKDGNEIEEFAETENQFAVRQFLIQKEGRHEKEKARYEKARDMNPNGFWEMSWTVGGIRYLPFLWEEYRDAREAPLKVCKVVSQGLAQSDPSKVSKVVFLARHPRQVAKSQEALRGRFPGDEEPKKDGEEVRIHSVRMFLQVTVQAARWFIRHPEVPVHVVNFDDLISDPTGQIQGVQDFLQEPGNWEAAKAQVDPKLKRSEPEARDGSHWDLAQRLFDLLLVKDWAGIVQEVETWEPPAQADQKKGPVHCTRLGRRVSAEECDLCHGHVLTQVNFIKNATKRGIDWVAEPCLREVLDGDKTIEESVLENHWVKVVGQ